MDGWQCDIQIADGSLPTPGIYGVPEQWPHIAALYLRNGFNPDRSEIVFLANVIQLIGPAEPPLRGLRGRRIVGINGTRFVAMLDGHEYGQIEVERLDQPERRVGPALADIGNLWVDENHQRQGIGTWLVHQAGRWLALGGAIQLLAYATPDETALISFLERTGFENDHHHPTSVDPVDAALDTGAA